MGILSILCIYFTMIVPLIQSGSLYDPGNRVYLSYNKMLNSPNTHGRHYHKGNLKVSQMFCEQTGEKTTQPLLECLRHCEKRGLGNPVRILIHETNISREVPIYTCTKWKRTLILTETWTFSRLPPIEKLERIPVDLEECRHVKDKFCKTTGCGMSAPTPKYEYHWASDTETELTYVLIEQSLTSSAMSTYKGDQISIEGKLVDLSKHSSQSSDDLLYFWDVEEVSLDKSCKWEISKVLDCFHDSKQGIYCPTIGLGIQHYTDINDILCKGLQISESGVIFKMTDNVPINSSYYPILDEKIKLSDQESAMYSSVVSSLEFRDYQRCLTSCYSLDITKDIPQSTGYGFIVYRNNKIHSCKLEYNCKLMKPIKICAGSHLIKARCNGESRWLDLNDSFSWLGSTCSHIDPNLHELRTYNLIINSSGVYIPEFTDVHQFVAKEIDQDSLVISKGVDSFHPYSILTDGINEVKTKSVHIPHPFTQMMANMISYFYDLSHGVKVVLIIVILLIVGFIGLRFLSERLKYQKSIPVPKTESFQLITT
ncbi:TPA_asm: G [Durio betacytorhabdovirus 1]|nr:TPA_asm: G [Durio betacytorhabdovirus 1]